MRILIATTYRNMVGGVEKYLQSIMPALAERGHSVALIYEHPCDRLAERIDEDRQELPAWCIADQGLEDALRAAAAWEPDVVYLQGFSSSEVEDALLESYPVVFYAHNYYGTCVSGRKCHLTPTPRPCDRTIGLGCLLQYYPRRCGGLHPGTMLRMYRDQRGRQARLPRFKTLLVASEHMYREFERHGVGRGQLEVLTLPVCGPGLDRPPECTFPAENILMAGRLTDLKGGAMLIRAIGRASQTLGRSLKLTVAGDGPERGNLERLAGALGARATFRGWLDQEQAAACLRDADLLAIPSIWPEPFGLVGVEAGKLGIPAVGYAVGGIPDWLIASEAGELAPGDPPTVDGLADAIVRALGDPDHYQHLCVGAWRNASRYRLDVHITKLEAILGRSKSAGRDRTEPRVLVDKTADSLR